FSDGGTYQDPAAAIAHGLQLVADGADILDIGGEASNPHASPIHADEELRRVLPVIAGLAGAGVAISIDTTKAAVARAAVAAGATIVNDVSAGLFDPAMADTLDALPGVTYIAGHLRGHSIAEVFAQEAPSDWRVVADELNARLATLSASVRSRTWVDPGIGFGKGADPDGNLALLRHAGDLSVATGGAAVVVGPSRKRFLARLVATNTGSTGTVEERSLLDIASASACILGARFGARIVRAHNVALLRDALAVYTRIGWLIRSSSSSPA
ncbi:MAG: dihydropteroate synthase, partial [Proteobacteria bacterium]|nr:dihydropteroate synthase [Pseudomonadota bacterium]